MNGSLRRRLILGALVLAMLAPLGCAHHGSRMRMNEEQMQAMDQRQAKLDQLVAAMNAATGEAKVDAIAAVVNEMAAQHKMMHEHMRMRRAER